MEDRRSSANADEEITLAPIAREFCAFLVRASDLHASLDRFLDEGCSEFRGCSLDGEHKLEWTDSHRRYLALLESNLEDFLQEREASAEELCEKLESSLGGSVWSLPLLRTLDYQHFAQQMIARSAAASLRAEAEASAAACSLGGVWKCVPQKTEPRGLDRFLRAQGVPWILRRLHAFAGASELSIVEMRGTVPTFSLLLSRSHGFGLTLDEVVADRREREAAGTCTTAWLEGAELHVLTRSQARDVPVIGATEVSVDRVVGLETQYLVEEGGMSLRVLRRVLLEDGASGRDDSYSEYFSRTGCTLEKLIDEPQALSQVEQVTKCLAKAAPAQLATMASPAKAGAGSGGYSAKAPVDAEPRQTPPPLVPSAPPPMPAAPPGGPRAPPGGPRAPAAPPGGPRAGSRGPPARRFRPAT